jgi:hypothetical protein|tara:strand:- start:2118 stop:2828 length:711 start_codon:yes stop_codon:yes gene_type:complete
MASTFSSNLKLELITTGEKSGTWGTITNTNLQQLEQAASGYISIDVASSNQTLTISNGAVSNGKNLYLKLTGTLAANRTVTVPDTVERIYVVEDATSRTTNNYTLTIKTASEGTGQVLPVASTTLIYSDGTNVKIGLRRKGYITTTGTYTAVADDQVLVDTSSSSVTVNLPASPSIGNEVHFIDSKNFFGSNNLTVGRNGSNILGAASNLTVSTNGSAFTLVYVNATRGWAYKTKI